LSPEELDDLNGVFNVVADHDPRVVSADQWRRLIVYVHRLRIKPITGHDSRDAKLLAQAPHPMPNVTVAVDLAKDVFEVAVSASAVRITGRSGRRAARSFAHLGREVGRYVKELKNGELRNDAAKVAEEENLDGKYLLTITDPSLSAEDVALGY
jgi:hypothetical protein